MEMINSNYEKRVKTFLCLEYSSGFQLNLFDIKMQDIIEPVLDVGCGEHAHLVSFLNNHGVNAVGIDRKTIRRRYTIENDWMRTHSIYPNSLASFPTFSAHKTPIWAFIVNTFSKIASDVSTGTPSIIT